MTAGGCAAAPRGPASRLRRVSASRGTILVIDDEDAVQRLVRFPLEREGYRVLGAMSGEEGLRLVEAERPDLVLLDLMLPGMDGIEVCRRLRVLSATLPIIMLTARDDEVDKVLGLEIGADDYVTKPFSLAELRSRVRAVLRRAQRARRRGRGRGRARGDGRALDVAAPHRRRATASRVQLTYVEFEILRSADALARSRAQPPRAARERLGVGRLPRAAHDRRARPAPAREARADPSGPLLIQTVRGVGYRFGA